MVEQEKLHLESLSPKKDVPDSDINGQLGALRFAFDDKAKGKGGYLPILNIALTGGYGTGKSSVIETFKAQNSEKSFIHLAFTQFEPYPQEENKDRERLIEAKILNQLVHQIPAHKIPRTRFPNKKGLYHLGDLKALPGIPITIAAIASIVLGLMSLIVLSYFKDWNIPFLLKHQFQSGQPIMFIIASAVLMFAAIFALAWVMLSVWLGGTRLSGKLKAAAGGQEIELAERQEDQDSMPLLDRYLTEILYLLDKAEADAIVIEDLDRGKDNLIFTQLREICRLANHTSRKRKKPLRFIYLLKDEIFDPEDRTKFFDLIVPVTPVLGVGIQAKRMVQALMEKSGIGTDENRMEGLIEIISEGITDYRLLKNIFNEFIVSWKALKKKDGLGLEHDERALLLAFTIYKNLFPGDYGFLRKDYKGGLYDVVSGKAEKVGASKGVNTMHVRLLNRLLSEAYITQESYPLCISRSGDTLENLIDMIVRRNSEDEASILQTLGALRVHAIAPKKKLVVQWAGYDWRVLEVREEGGKTKALLLSEYILQEKAYNDENKDITWEQCSLRKYLNGEDEDKKFYEEFTGKSHILPADGTVKDIPKGDLFFLLSAEELIKYFSSEINQKEYLDENGSVKKERKQRGFISDGDDEKREARKKGEEQTAWWWLRSPGYYQRLAATVGIDGYVGLSGDSVDYGTGGVRPALWLNL